MMRRSHISYANIIWTISLRAIYLFVSLQIWHLIYTLHHVEMCKIKTKIYKYEIFGKHKIMETLASAAINSLRIYLPWGHAFRQQVICPLLKVYMLWWLPIMCISKLFNTNSICINWDYQVICSCRKTIKNSCTIA